MPEFVDHGLLHALRAVGPSSLGALWQPNTGRFEPPGRRRGGRRIEDVATQYFPARLQARRRVVAPVGDHD